MRSLVVLVLVVACGHPVSPRSPGLSPGKVHRAIQTTSPEAQRHFDLGLAHAYGFNFDEAQFEFLAALHEDPTCAMCMWGVAYCAGSNINERDKRWPGALEAAGKATSLAQDVTERHLGRALLARYDATPADHAHPVPTPAAGEHGEHGGAPAQGPPPADHMAQDRAYADAMRALADAHPDDDDIAILYAESLMLVVPAGSAYWPATPVPEVTQARAALERVLARSPDHVGAIHFYIHLMEDSRERGKALPYADKLATLAPGAGHLIHMASHLYLKVGRYADAEDGNKAAIAADVALLRRMSPGSTYAKFAMHPKHFLWETLLWEGKRDEAKRLAAELGPYFDKLAATNPNAYGLGGVVRAWTTVRFGDWDDALALPVPTLPLGAFATHYARGLAFVAKRDVTNMYAELEAFTKLPMDVIPQPQRDRFSGVVDVARQQLKGAIKFAEGKREDAIAELELAVALEDKLDNPLEPPLWIFPARQRLGAVLLAMGKNAEAADVYRADLVRHPENGWSLYGLATALEALKDPTAPAVRARFEKAWARSDIKLTSSVL